MSDPNELCLSVPSAWVADHLNQGINPGGIGGVLKDAGYCFVPRSEADRSTTHKHVCTYAVITCGEKVFVYRRGKTGGEFRLHGAYSLGVGGHVTDADIEGGINFGWNVAESVKGAALREANEELDWDGPIASVDLGVIVDDDDPVGRVHLGACYRFEVADTSATSREDCLAEAGWMGIASAKEQIASFEGWSRILLRDAL